MKKLAEFKDSVDPRELVDQYADDIRAMVLLCENQVRVNIDNRINHPEGVKWLIQNLKNVIAEYESQLSKKAN